MEEVPPQGEEQVAIVIPSEVKDVYIKPTQDRRSERLKKDTTITTKEKNERMAKKRNLEGNYTNQNMFSALPLDDIADLTSGMGVNIDASDFETFGMLKNLECARNDLFVKQKVSNQVPQTETVGIDEPNRSPLLLEWLQEEQSDDEEFTLVLQEKKARDRKKNIKFSPNLAKK